MILRKSVSVSTLDVVRHVLAEPRAGAVEQPEAAEGVLDEVADDPVRGEELGDGGDVVRRPALFCAGHDLVFPLGDVELVEPAEDLDLLPVLVGQRLRTARSQHRIICQQGGRDEYLGKVTLPLEHERHCPVPVAAIFREQQPIGLALRGPRCGGRRYKPVTFSRVLVPRLCVDGAALTRQGPRAGRQRLRPPGKPRQCGVAIRVHEPQRNDAV